MYNCPFFIRQCYVLSSSLQTYINILDTDFLLKRSFDLSFEENIEITLTIQNFIDATGRFQVPPPLR